MNVEGQDYFNTYMASAMSASMSMSTIRSGRNCDPASGDSYVTTCVDNKNGLLNYLIILIFIYLPAQRYQFPLQQQSQCLIESKYVYI